MFIDPYSKTRSHHRDLGIHEMVCDAGFGNPRPTILIAAYGTKLSASDPELRIHPGGYAQKSLNVPIQRRAG